MVSISDHKNNAVLHVQLTNPIELFLLVPCQDCKLRYPKHLQNSADRLGENGRSPYLVVPDIGLCLDLECVNVFSIFDHNKTWGWVKDLKDEGVDLMWVSSKNNMADILTKCLSNKEFNRQLDQISEKGNS